MLKSIIIFHFLLLLSSRVLGVVEENHQDAERLKVDWAALVLKFYGEASQANKSEPLDWKALEKSAWDDGLAYLGIHVPEYAANDLRLMKFKADLEKNRQAVKRHAYSRNTIYHSDGRVQVELELPLPAIFTSAQVSLAGEHELSDDLPRNTGLLLMLDSDIKPRVLYTIENGDEQLFSVKDVAAAGFEKNLMGRWVKAREASTIAKYVGDNPVKVSVSIKDAQLTVSEDEWKAATAGNIALLQQAKIVLVRP